MEPATYAKELQPLARSNLWLPPSQTHTPDSPQHQPAQQQQPQGNSGKKLFGGEDRKRIDNPGRRERPPGDAAMELVTRAALSSNPPPRTQQAPTVQCNDRRVRNQMSLSADAGPPQSLLIFLSSFVRLRPGKQYTLCGCVWCGLTLLLPDPCPCRHCSTLEASELANRTAD
jgi:hypothetical protein